MVADSQPFKEEVIPANQVPRDASNETLPLCPRCHGNDFVLRGFLKVERTEVWRGGNLVSVTMPNEERGQYTFEASQLSCMSCNRLFYIVTPEEYARQKQIVARVPTG